jgi:predicted ferric reductase
MSGVAALQLRYALRGGAWVAVYLGFVLAPLFALLIGRLPPSRDFWTEFSVAMGYSGLAIMGLQFGLTARFRYVTAPWGEDVIYHLHRQISLLAVALVVAHPLILFAVRPDLLVLLNSFTAPWRARFAAFSTYSLIVLVMMALWRGRWKIRYETWHALHIALAVVAVAAGLAHMVGWSFYLDNPAKRTLWIGLTLFWIGLLLYVRMVKPLFLLRRPYRVSEVRRERGESVTLAMMPDGHAGYRFKPGQFGWLTISGNPFQITGHPFSF